MFAELDFFKESKFELLVNAFSFVRDGAYRVLLFKHEVAPQLVEF